MKSKTFEIEINGDKATFEQISPGIWSLKNGRSMDDLNTYEVDCLVVNVNDKSIEIIQPKRLGPVGPTGWTRVQRVRCRNVEVHLYARGRRHLIQAPSARVAKRVLGKLHFEVTKCYSI